MAFIHMSITGAVDFIEFHDTGSSEIADNTR